MIRTTLTVRLTTLYTLVSGFVLACLATLVVVASSRHFAALDRDFLADKARLVSGNSVADLAERLHDMQNGHHGMYLQAWSNGRLVFGDATLGVPNTLIAGAASSQPADWTVDGRSLRAVSHDVSLATGATGDQTSAANRVRVVLALDTHQHTAFLSALGKTLAAFVLVATTISGLLGWWAARTGLRPLRTMRERAMDVTAHGLHERMPVESVPVEMADLARSLNHMLERLEQDFSRLQEFSGDLAHELRTPINNLMMQTQVSLSRRRDVDAYRDVLASNAEEFQRLARMVADMLFLAQAERGLELPRREIIRLHDEVAALFEFYDAVAEEKRIQQVLQGEGRVMGDRLMIRRAISNLLSNALRHGSTQSVVMAALSESGGEVHLQVVNQGIRIEADQLARLFDRFYRVDKSRAHPDSDGAGLGLAITRAIMSAHGGSVAVHSDDSGTRFDLRFPAASDLPLSEDNQNGAL